VHIELVQRILKEAILPEKVDVILAANAFNQAVGQGDGPVISFLESGSMTFSWFLDNRTQRGLAAMVRIDERLQNNSVTLSKKVLLM
jgi:hypothetical protein